MNKAVTQCGYTVCIGFINLTFFKYDAVFEFAYI